MQLNFPSSSPDAAVDTASSVRTSTPGSNAGGDATGGFADLLAGVTGPGVASTLPGGPAAASPLPAQMGVLQSAAPSPGIVLGSPPTGVPVDPAMVSVIDAEIDVGSAAVDTDSGTTGPTSVPSSHPSRTARKGVADETDVQTLAVLGMLLAPLVTDAGVGLAPVGGDTTTGAVATTEPGRSVDPNSSQATNDAGGTSRPALGGRPTFSLTRELSAAGRGAHFALAASASSMATTGVVPPPKAAIDPGSAVGPASEEVAGELTQTLPTQACLSPSCDLPQPPQVGPAMAQALPNPCIGTPIVTANAASLLEGMSDAKASVNGFDAGTVVRSTPAAPTSGEPVSQATAVARESGTPNGAQLPTDAGAAAQNSNGASTASTVQAMRAATSVIAAMSLPEKIAPVAGKADAGGAVDGIRGIKTALGSDVKQVAKHGAGIGITTAEARPTMPSGSMLDHPTDTAAAVVHTGMATGDAKPDPVPAMPMSSLSTAHRAVEAVMNVTERFTAHDQNSVNLQFKVAGSDLNVRVELRGGEVRTTFRTDSAELRNALSTEWQSVTAQSNGDRSVRLAPAVFTTSANYSGSASGQGADRHAQQHGQPQQQGHRDARSGFSPSSSGPRTTSSAPATSSTTTSPRRLAGNSVHLHTLA